MTTSDHTPIESFGPVPEGWMWGVATAAHQIEGGNTNNDWWRFEHAQPSGAAEPSGDACDSWNRWEEDLDLVKAMGLDVYRFSVEWSRIEPSDGTFDDEALRHYRAIAEGCHERGLKACVTMHHFTFPLWLADMGGAESPELSEKFARFCAKVADAMGDQIDIACTINEPNIVALVAYVAGAWPPAVHGDLEVFRRVIENFISAHRAGRDALKAGPGDFPVGLTLALADTYFHPDGTWDGPSIRLPDLPREGPLGEFAYLMTRAFLDVAKEDDFIGIQTYSDVRVGPDGQNLPIPGHVRGTQMNWTYSPEALGETVRQAYAVAGVPVIVTENGCPTRDDAERIEYISRALTALRGAMDDGVDVRGYIHWSLLDNFEWAEGYRPLFGLVACDRKTFKRTPKPSSEYYAKIVASTR